MLVEIYSGSSTVIRVAVASAPFSPRADSSSSAVVETDQDAMFAGLTREGTRRGGAQRKKKR